jgi:hypothetical protein
LRASRTLFLENLSFPIFDKFWGFGGEFFWAHDPPAL